MSSVPAFTPTREHVQTVQAHFAGWPMHHPEIWDRYLQGAAKGYRVAAGILAGSVDAEWLERAADCLDHIALTTFDIPDHVLARIGRNLRMASDEQRFYFFYAMMRFTSPAFVRCMSAEEWLCKIEARAAWAYNQARADCTQAASSDQ